MSQAAVERLGVVERRARGSLLALLAVLGLLAAADLISLWLVPPSERWQWVVIWETFVGIGCAAAGGSVTWTKVTRLRGTWAGVTRSGVSGPAGSGPSRLGRDGSGRGGSSGDGVVTGWLLVGSAVLFLAAPLVRAAGQPTGSDVLAVLALLTLVPLAALLVVPVNRGRAVLLALQAAIVVSGLIATAATALGLPAVAQGAAFGPCVALACGLWVQFEVTAGDARRQVLWLILGVWSIVPACGAFVAGSQGPWVGPAWLAVLISVLSLPLPPALAIAVLGPRALDVRALISQAVVLTVMLTLTVAVYRGSGAAVEVITGRVGAGVDTVLVLVIAIGFHPALVMVRTTIDELLFGGRPDPVDTLARLGTQLTEGSSPSEWLDTLRAALAVPGIVLRQGPQAVAASGVLVGETVTMTLRAGAEPVGELVVGLPPEQLRLAPTTQAVLGLVAGPLAQALHAIRLQEQVQASRGRVVTALEEERRRVRRDLHDGLGPTLTGIAYSADAALNLLHADADQAGHVLRDLRADAGEAIAEVRRIVYGLRPKALDELGLVAAVRQQLSHLRAADGTLMRVQVEAPPRLPDLLAAVEVAAYRVAVEAVTNTARHAGVSAAEVCFRVEGEARLQVIVRDAGRSNTPWQHGVGLHSMRERVEQIGGVLRVESGPGGATLTAELPLDSEPAEPRAADRLAGTL